MSKNVIGGTKARIGHIVKVVVLFILLIAYMFPFFMVLINSFKRKVSIVRDPLALVDSKGFYFQNYPEAFESMRFPAAFMNSLLITVLSMILIVLFAAMAAYVFVRTKYLASRISFGMMLAAMIIPFQALMIPLVSIYGNTLNLLNNRATLIFLNFGFGMGLAVFMYHGAIKSGVPISLEEAALLDGCNKYQTFFMVVFPLLKTMTSTLVVLDVLWLWNDYLMPSLILTKRDLFTLPLSTYRFYGTYTSDLGLIMAALVMTVTPVIILYLFLQRHIIAGVVSGAVKS
ncbi:carbohydrate ABC transporter permease [Massiliimalia massiliensis]|uniref:carbohydrate ABC transporter permease n=1 Tax=Massiliimalia massiliensis TaxID=1852384 RepID=UPI0009841F72|nr:carbohydrate ABC transporter permease [Massiliimalia massiliensis]